MSTSQSPIQSQAFPALELVAASASRLDQDLVARLQQLSDDQAEVCEWREPITSAFIESALWLTVAATCWILAVTFF